ncbi:hypothetical protein BdWA1_000674 [Babesia duncani]|uniref:Uncharacterized protein n=1 Tax=Babesia duncani TaxID=323732 RepID=A0AAD9PML7_9APIC|nr:hypothetical protein BdWA1_000674 [Babesia duncani]
MGLCPYDTNLYTEVRENKEQYIGHTILRSKYVDCDKNVAFISALQNMNISRELSVARSATASITNSTRLVNRATWSNNTSAPKIKAQNMTQNITSYKQGQNTVNYPITKGPVDKNSYISLMAKVPPQLTYSKLGPKENVRYMMLSKTPTYGNTFYKQPPVPTRSTILIKNHLNDTTPIACPASSILPPPSPQLQEETLYPELALDLNKLKQRQLPKEPVKQKGSVSCTKSSSMSNNKSTKITMGKPMHTYTSKYSDAVDKELERWHNSHNSTLIWKRLKRGVYNVGQMQVKIVKLNGTLYIKEHPFEKLPNQCVIQRFAQELQNSPMMQNELDQAKKVHAD